MNSLQPSLLLDIPVLSREAKLAGTALALLIHASVIGLGLYGSSLFVSDKTALRPQGPEIQIIEAQIARLGKEIDPKQLPDRVVPLQATAPEDVVVSKQPLPPTTDAGVKPKDAKDDILKRLGDRAQAFAEIAKQREREGEAQGLAEGTATKSRAGDLYAAKLQLFIREGWSAPTLIGEAELKQLKAEVDVEITADGKIGASRLRKSSHNELFDQSVLTQVERLRGETVPAPPEEVKGQYWGRTVGFRFHGRDAD